MLLIQLDVMDKIPSLALDSHCGLDKMMMFDDDLSEHPPFPC